jgi:hypothetical protein
MLKYGIAPADAEEWSLQELDARYAASVEAPLQLWDAITRQDTEMLRAVIKSQVPARLHR